MCAAEGGLQPEVTVGFCPVRETLIATAVEFNLGLQFNVCWPLVPVTFNTKGADEVHVALDGWLAVK